MRMTTAPGQSATLPSVDSMPTKILSMTKPYGWIFPSSVNFVGSQIFGDTVLMISHSHLLQYIQSLHRSWDTRPGSNGIYTSSITICSTTTRSLEYASSTTRSGCPAPFPRSRGSFRGCVVCAPRSKYDIRIGINE